jgi:Arc/MetJ family transcription regulator
MFMDIDDDALAGATREFGAKTTDGTVHRALADLAGRGARLAALEHLRTTSDDLGDAGVMDSIWRQPVLATGKPVRRGPRGSAD